MTNLESYERAILNSQELESLPIQQILNQFSEKAFVTDSQNKCPLFPPVLWDIKYNNSYWQILKTKDSANIYLYGAYYDDRSVYLSAMVDHVPPPPVYCQLWLNNRKEQFLTTATFRPLCFKEWGNFKNGELLPYTISCKFPIKIGLSVPDSVSLLDDMCQNVTNNLQVFRRKEKLSSVACIKGLAIRHFNISLKLIEWIKLLRSEIEYTKKPKTVDLTESMIKSKSMMPRISTLKTSSSKNLHLRIAPNIKVDEMLLIRNWARTIPSLPLQYRQSAIFYKTSRCASYPKLTDINFHNEIWQEWNSKLSGANFYIFGAYWDNRSENKPAVHLLVMVDQLSPPDVICQLWYKSKENKTPFAVEPTATPSYAYIWNPVWGNYREGVLQPYLLTCLLTSRKDPPLSVSLVDRPCDNANNNVLVVVGKERKQESTNNTELKFAVCVKGLNFYFDDVSVRLIEWLELLRAVGAHKVFLYDLAVHPNVTKVLKYYEDQNFVHVSPLTLPGQGLNVKPLMNFYFKHKARFKRQAEIFPYNDCFHRHRHEYDYIALLDIDEIIVPLQENTWNDLLHRLTENGTKTGDSFHASNVYFFDDSVHSHGWDKDIPTYLHMMQHTWRARNHTQPNYYVKSFFSTKSVLTLHNHMPISCLDYENGNRPCKPNQINKTIAQLQHYRKDCDRQIPSTCEKLYHKYLVSDDNLKRYLEPVVSRTNITLISLGFIE
uniref:Glycosyltransferase family 92 protein n=1 Tax=Strigamia maritima TaxID=126957 RepID=T1IJ88_STRMM